MTATAASSDRPTLAVLGGTGSEGSALALRWANAGYPVVIGSRNAEKAAQVCAQINARLGRAAALARQLSRRRRGRADRRADRSLRRAAQHGRRSARCSSHGKILIDTTVPLVPPKVARVQLPEGGSAVAAIQALLGESVKVVSAFQNVSAHLLQDLAAEVDCDVLVCGDDVHARETGHRAGRGYRVARPSCRSDRQLGCCRSAHLGSDLDQCPIQGGGRRHPHHSPGKRAEHDRQARLEAECSAGQLEIGSPQTRGAPRRAGRRAAGARRRRPVRNRSRAHWHIATRCCSPAMCWCSRRRSYPRRRGATCRAGRGHAFAARAGAGRGRRQGSALHRADSARIVRGAACPARRDHRGAPAGVRDGECRHRLFERGRERGRHARAAAADRPGW